jgi:leucyl-tRNA synthetase
MDYEKEILEIWSKEKYEEDYNKPKYFITAAFPYPNSPQHIGHARTYTLADVYARFYRIQGYNVIFPMGFHVTGTPIISMADRIKEKDPELKEIFEKIYDIPEEVYSKLTDPKELVMFFAKEIEEGMKRMGYSIDWSRKFYTSDERFEKFIQWQFMKLYKKGYLIKGKHAIPYSIKLNSSIGAHDTKGDIDPEIDEYVGIFFPSKIGDLLVATVRPETIYGVTNLWINKNHPYIIAKLNDKKVIISKSSYEVLQHQLELEYIQDISTDELLNLKVTVPLLNKEIPIFHGDYVDPKEGTGIVMSVPAHSIFDYVMYMNISSEYPIIISIDGKPSDAKNYLNSNLKEANEKLYSDEFNKGFHLILNKSVKEAREEVKKLLDWIKIYRIANRPVYTRAGDEVIVKIIPDQWFINYGDPAWKEEVRKAMNEILIIPEEFKARYLNTIEWLDKKACTRSKGLGTKFIFDNKLIVESLSDSTIYMAYYLLLPEINNYSLEQLDEKFFDYIFYGLGNPIDETHIKLRRRFEYYYGVDARHSGVDLINNHLTFYIFNHVAIFPTKLPKAIITNGSVLMEGKKMSKSLGNIIPIKKAVERYGADSIRLTVLSTDIGSDSNFSDSAARGVKDRLNEYINRFKNIGEGKMASWLRYKLYTYAKDWVENYKQYKIKNIIDNIFYKFYNDLKWAEIRGDNSIPEDVAKSWLVIMSPIIPFTTEYISRNIFKVPVKDLKVDLKQINNHIEDYLIQIIEDMVIVSSKGGTKLYIGIAKKWKFDAYNLISEKGLEEAIKLIPEAKELVSKLKNKIYNLNFNYKYEDVLNYLKENKSFLESYLKISIEIGEEKSKYALPDRPELILE